MAQKKQTDTQTRLITVMDMAERLGISRTMAYKLVWDGEIPSVKIGTAVRIKSSDVDRFIDGLESGGQDQTLS